MLIRGVEEVCLKKGTLSTKLCSNSVIRSEHVVHAGPGNTHWFFRGSSEVDEEIRLEGQAMVR